jgi:flagellar hook assembly protein FlgD
LTSEGIDIFLAQFMQDPTGVTVPGLVATLGRNYPNPFNPATTIEYTLSEQSSAVLGIYNAAGRLVVRLDQGVRDVGTHRAEWNGRDASGRVVGSGVYFYRLEGAPGVMARKMVLLK